MSLLHNIIALLLTLHIATTNRITTTTAGEYQGKTITCTDNEPCYITCGTANSCQNAVINCPTDALCDVLCSNSYACSTATIYAQASSYFRLLDCETGVWTCVGITLFVPPHNNGIPRAQFIGADLGLSAGIDFKTPLHFYAFNSWKDISVTPGPLFSWAMHKGVMHCHTNYADTCEFASEAWSCANTNDACAPSLPTPAPTSSPTKRPTNKPTNKPIYNTVPTIKPTIKPTNKPTIKPTTNKPTDKPNAIPSVAASSDCVGVSNLDRSNLNGNWEQFSTLNEHLMYNMNSYWLYYVSLRSQGYWMIGTTQGSIDWSTIEAYCMNEDVTQCSGLFSVLSDNGYVVDGDSVVVSECSTSSTTTTTTKAPSKRSNPHYYSAEEDEADKFDINKIVISGYIVPWYAFLIILFFMCICCSICGLFCKAKMAQKKQYKPTGDNQYGDHVQMLKR